MFNDSKLRQIEDDLKRHRSDLDRLRKEELTIRDREEKAISRIRLDSKHELDRITRRIQDNERDVAHLESHRQTRQQEIERELERTSHSK